MNYNYKQNEEKVIKTIFSIPISQKINKLFLF